MIILTGALIFIIVGTVAGVPSLTDVRTLSCLGMFVLGYIVGFQISQPPAVTSICRRDPSTGGLDVYEIVSYKQDGKQFLVEQNLKSVFAALRGRSQEIVLDMTVPHYKIPVRLNGTELEDVTLISSVEVQIMPDGKTKHVYHLAARMWERPEAFFFELASYTKAIDEAAILRAQLTRMDVEYRDARSNGIVDHVRNMMDLNVHNADMLARLKETIKDVKIPKEDCPDGGIPEL